MLGAKCIFFVISVVVVICKLNRVLTALFRPQIGIVVHTQFSFYKNRTFFPSLAILKILKF